MSRLNLNIRATTHPGQYAYGCRLERTWHWSQMVFTVMVSDPTMWESNVVSPAQVISWCAKTLGWRSVI